MGRVDSLRHSSDRRSWATASPSSKREALTEEQGRHHQQHQDEIGAGMDGNAGQIAVRRWTVDGGADHPGQHRQLQTAHEGEDKQPVAPGAITSRVGGHPPE